MKVKTDNTINMIENLPIGEANKVASYFDSRPLTDETLKELEFVNKRLALTPYMAIDIIGYPNKMIGYLYHYNIVGNEYDYSREYSTVGSVKMLISALKGDE